MSKFDGGVIFGRIMVSTSAGTTAADKEFAEKTLRQLKDKESAVVGPMVPVREIVTRIESSSTLQELKKATSDIILSRYMYYGNKWHTENEVSGKGVMWQSFKDQPMSLRGNKMVHVDATYVFGDMGLTVDFTIRKSRIVEERVVFLASPESSWERAHKDLLSIYEERAKLIVASRQGVIEPSNKAQGTPNAIGVKYIGVKVSSALGSGFRSLTDTFKASKTNT